MAQSSDQTFSFRNFAVRHSFVVESEPGIYIIQDTEQVGNRHQFSNETYPERYSGTGFGIWDNIVINWGLCDFVTSFGAANNNLPTSTQLNTWIRALFIAGPSQSSPMAGITTIKDTVSVGSLGLVKGGTSSGPITEIKKLKPGSSRIVLTNGTDDITIDTPLLEGIVIDPVDSNYKLSMIQNATTSAFVNVSPSPNPLIQVNSLAGEITLISQKVTIPNLSYGQAGYVIYFDTLTSEITYAQLPDPIPKIGCSLTLEKPVIIPTVATTFDFGSSVMTIDAALNNYDTSVFDFGAGTMIINYNGIYAYNVSVNLSYTVGPVGPGGSRSATLNLYRVDGGGNVLLHKSAQVHKPTASEDTFTISLSGQIRCLANEKYQFTLDMGALSGGAGTVTTINSGPSCFLCISDVNNPFIL